MESNSEESWKESEDEISSDFSKEKPEILFEKTKTKENIFCENCGVEIPKNSYTLKRLKIKSKNFENFDKEQFFCVNCRLCPNLHNMNYSYGLRNVLNKDLLPYKENTYFCDICDVTYEMEENDKVLKCLSCEYDICEKCEKKYYFFF